MRIDSLRVANFKKFADTQFDLHPRFTLFMGENGSGKTSVLDALAVAAGIWLADPPDSTLISSRREIFHQEIRLEADLKGDRVQFRELTPVSVEAKGKMGDSDQLSWTRQVRANGRRTTNADARDALATIKSIFARDAAGEDVLCPVLAYYGAGRAWLPSNKRVPKARHAGPARRWAAFYDCFNERIRFDELQSWFSRETTERGNRHGQWRPGFDAVRYAVRQCVPGADDVWFDADRDQIVISIGGHSQPFDNISAGQRMMLAVVADLAIKAVTQNAFLLPADKLAVDRPPDVLVQAPGLVLIDELDVHLHPKWQRRVAEDLKRTFPAIQFVCTSHSPQVIGELQPNEIRSLDENGVSTPSHSYGVDSSRVLEELMDAPSRNDAVSALLRRLYRAIDEEDVPESAKLLAQLETEVGSNDPEVSRARAMLSFLTTAV